MNKNISEFLNKCTARIKRKSARRCRTFAQIFNDKQVTGYQKKSCQTMIRLKKNQLNADIPRKEFNRLLLSFYYSHYS